MAGDFWKDRQFVSTFPTDFGIANAFGPSAVEDTFNRAFNEWKSDYKMLTDLVLTLNWYLWDMYEDKKMTLAAVYDKCWNKANVYAENHLKGEELDYFFKETD